MPDELEKLEVVYYPAPLPQSLRELTFFGLIFDRIHFPHVEIPIDGFDPDAVVAEIERLERLPVTTGGGYDRWLLRAMLNFALMPELRVFCNFTGDGTDVFGADMDPRVGRLVQSLYEQIHGVRENFTPQFRTGISKGLGDKASVNFPGEFFYQSRALLYSADHGIPLLNSDSRLPVPSLEAGNPKHNAKLLAAFIAMECAALVLPEMGELPPSRILEARADLEKHVKPFRMELLRMAAKLGAAIESEASSEEISATAKFIVQTDVYPTLNEFRNELAKPKKGWIDRSWKLTKVTPYLAAAFVTGNPLVAIPRIIEALGDWLSSGLSEQSPRSNLYYLLNLEKQIKGKSE
jgi:hypothetical protein